MTTGNGYIDTMVPHLKVNLIHVGILSDYRGGEFYNGHLLGSSKVLIIKLLLQKTHIYKMKKIINCFQDALEIREELAPKQTSGWHFLYRGHASTKYELLSSAGRKQPIEGYRFDSERKCLSDFKDLVKDKNWQQFMIPNYNEDMFFMSIGRHLGLDCRLLDWTAKLETALYFAASDKDNQEKDGCLWVMCYPNSINDSAAKLAPFNVNEIKLIKENFGSDYDICIT